MSYDDSIVAMEVAPYRLTGRIYGTLVNHRTALESLGSSVSAAPYKGTPRAPVLYIKPQNTLLRAGSAVVIPEDIAELEIGGCLGIVIGRTACAVLEQEAMQFVAGYLVVNDVSVPHEQYYRPSIRLKAQDGFCPLGSQVTAASALIDPNQLRIDVYIDGELRQSASTSELIRPIARLLADVTDFMTLSPGDVLAVGVAAPAPRVRRGQTAVVEIEHVGRLHTPFVGASS